jgi:hypothetical protein
MLKQKQLTAYRVWFRDRHDPRDASCIVLGGSEDMVEYLKDHIRKTGQQIEEISAEEFDKFFANNHNE